MREAEYSFHRALPDCSYEEAVRRVSEALQTEGFGILTEIDVRATLKEKLGAEFRPYVILGACNPQLAHRALETDDNIGLLLPCNVVVAGGEEGAEVAIASPRAMLEVAGNPALQPVADEAESRLRRALKAL